MTAPQKQQIFPASRIRVEDRSPPIPSKKRRNSEDINNLYTIDNKVLMSDK